MVEPKGMLLKNDLGISNLIPLSTRKKLAHGFLQGEGNSLSLEI